MKSDFEEKDQLTGSMRPSFRPQSGDRLANRKAFFELSFLSIHTLFLCQPEPFPPAWKPRVLIILNVKVSFQRELFLHKQNQQMKTQLGHTAHFSLALSHT